MMDKEQEKQFKKILKQLEKFQLEKRIIRLNGRLKQAEDWKLAILKRKGIVEEILITKK